MFLDSNEAQKLIRHLEEVRLLAPPQKIKIPSTSDWISESALAAVLATLGSCDFVVIAFHTDLQGYNHFRRFDRDFLNAMPADNPAYPSGLRSYFLGVPVVVSDKIKGLHLICHEAVADGVASFLLERRDPWMPVGTAAPVLMAEPPGTGQNPPPENTPWLFGISPEGSKIQTIITIRRWYKDLSLVQAKSLVESSPVKLLPPNGEPQWSLGFAQQLVEELKTAGALANLL